ncbi:hypothetical protein [Mycobacteroides abscessus]|uniref:hypothetical protein n=1 Tax=Mycobacteroides abscessus TaxID=36809 RepID=UPI001053919C|nr:hypothetical protein [Mycobacteroides abscessus]
MIHRPAPSSRSRSVTSPARVSLLTCGFTLATLAVATFNTSVAHANTPNTDICDPSSDYYIGGALCGTPTPAPSSGGSGGGGIGDWFSDFIGSPLGTLLFFGGIAAFVAWVVIAVRRDSAAEKEQRAAAQAARGRAIAEQHHAEQRALAEQAALAQVPPRETYDPMNMGVAPAPIEVQSVPAPPTDPEDLQRYATFSAAVPWEPGTAFAAVVSRDGDWSRARTAFASACEAAGLGETDEADAFTPDAVVAEVRTIGGDTDAVVLAVRPAGLHVGSAQLDRVRPFLVRTARVAEASPFVREPSTDLYLTTLRNAVQEQPAAPAPDTAPTTDPSNWEW